MHDVPGAWWRLALPVALAMACSQLTSVWLWQQEHESARAALLQSAEQPGQQATTIIRKLDSVADSEPLTPGPRSVMLVVQYELAPGHWLHLSAPLAEDVLFAPFGLRHAAWQLVVFLGVLVVTLLLLRRLPAAPSSIQDRWKDRRRLFIDISHSLKTPITRLKLRTEMMQDSQVREAFHEDLDELDRMVKTALQSLRETDIHENPVSIRLHVMLERLTRRPIDPDVRIHFTGEPVAVCGKPLALERALSNLLDNAVLYGQQVEVQLRQRGSMAVVEIRDFGPGIPAAQLSAVFEPRVRLRHGTNRNRNGSGLGLGIAKGIVQAHHGEIHLHNHDERGLVITVLLPTLPPPPA